MGPSYITLYAPETTIMAKDRELQDDDGDLMSSFAAKSLPVWSAFSRTQKMAVALSFVFQALTVATGHRQGLCVK